MISLTEPGQFVVGCNYWASHAGTNMWSDWQPEVVADDLRQLAEAGLQVLRVFPLWPDFQPLALLRTGGGRPNEFRLGEAPLPDTEAGRAGVSEQAMDHFGHFADLAEQNGLKLVVGLLTGWMSGRLFVPPAFEALNVLTDPLAIQWEVRYVKHFVRCLRDHPAILAWDLGNECNCMGPVTHPSQAWNWTNTIVDAIRVEDATRPIVSGMHSLHPQRDAVWRMQDQGELTDLLTTHPYPIFTPHCDLDPINTMRSGLHAVAESRYYGDIGGQPCLAEELGTLGPMISSEQVAADYIRMVLMALWAHDCHGLLWWCAYDQYHLEHAPYDWHSYERELGLFRKDRSAKPVTAAIGAFRTWLETLPIASLPPRLTEAICILSHGQDQWANAYASFILAKQAGFDITFQYVDQPLRPAQLYLLPGLRAGESYTRRFWLELEARVRAGATLYVSHDDCLLSPFAEPFGLQVETRSRRAEPAHLRLASHPEAELVLPAPFRLALSSTRAEVLGYEPDGNPLWTRASLGQGQTWFLGLPLERLCAETPGALTGDGPYSWIYRDLIAGHLGQRALRQADPTIGVTEHPLDAQQRVVVLINYAPQASETTCQLAEGWALDATWYGQEPAATGGALTCTLAANDGLVLLLKR